MTYFTEEDDLRLSIAMALSKIKTKPRGASEIMALPLAVFQQRVETHHSYQSFWGGRSLTVAPPLLLLILTSLSCAILSTPPSIAQVAQREVIEGIGNAKDGDGIIVGDTEIRLAGIDAPEPGQVAAFADFMQRRSNCLRTTRLTGSSTN
jgi:hypothetical protein